MEESGKGKPGRPKKTRINPDESRQKIKANWIIAKLQKHIAGEVEMTITQVKACDVLLRKIVPDVTTTRLTGDVFHRFVVEVPPLMTREEWIERYTPPAVGPVLDLPKISNGGTHQE